MEPALTPNDSHIAAIVCGIASLIVVLMFGAFAWALYSEQRCASSLWSSCWGGGRRTRDRAHSDASTAGSELSAAGSTAKPSAPGPACTPAQAPTIPVIVIGPDGSTALGTVPGAMPPPGAPAGASAAAAPPARPSPSLAERRAAEALRAAYIAELEEREANRHSYARRNGGLAGSSMGWSALSFLPFLV